MAVKPAPKKASTQKTDKVTNRTVSTYVAASALSTDVGQKAVAAFTPLWGEEKHKLEQMQNAAKTSKGATLHYLTMAFIKAAKNDKGVKLTDIYAETTTQAYKDLKLKLEVALGIRVVRKQEDGSEIKELSEWAQAYWPTPGDTKGTPTWQRKENFRTNWAPMWKKSIQAAHACILKSIAVHQKVPGEPPLLTGPGVKEIFGHDDILVNEKRQQERPGKLDKDGNAETVKLEKIPSYTELARVSAASQGRKVQTRVQSAATTSKGTEEDIGATCDILLNAVMALKGCSDTLAGKLEALSNEIEEFLERNEGVEETENKKTAA